MVCQRQGRLVPERPYTLSRTLSVQWHVLTLYFPVLSTVKPGRRTNTFYISASRYAACWRSCLQCYHHCDAPGSHSAVSGSHICASANGRRSRASDRLDLSYATATATATTATASNPPSSSTAASDDVEFTSSDSEDEEEEIRNDLLSSDSESGLIEVVDRSGAPSNSALKSDAHSSSNTSGPGRLAKAVRFDKEPPRPEVNARYDSCHVMPERPSGETPTCSSLLWSSISKPFSIKTIPVRRQIQLIDSGVRGPFEVFNISDLLSLHDKAKNVLGPIRSTRFVRNQMYDGRVFTAVRNYEVDNADV